MSVHAFITDLATQWLPTEIANLPVTNNLHDHVKPQPLGAIHASIREVGVATNCLEPIFHILNGGMQNFLSFNKELGGAKFSIAGYPDEEETDETRLALLQPMKLRTQWAFWEQPATGQYSLNKIATFSTAQEFWSIWNGVPQPSELLESRRFTRTSSNGQVFIEAIMIFREGIKPEWEDLANAQGGHFQLLLKPGAGAGQIDEYWNNIVLGTIGEVMESGHHVTGLRLVDKLSGKGKVTDAIRIELWYHSDATTAEVNALRKAVEKCLTMRLDGSAGSAFKSDALQDKKHGSLAK